MSNDKITDAETSFDDGTWGRWEAPQSPTEPLSISEVDGKKALTWTAASLNRHGPSLRIDAKPGEKLRISAMVRAGSPIQDWGISVGFSDDAMAPGSTIAQEWILQSGAHDVLGPDEWHELSGEFMVPGDITCNGTGLPLSHAHISIATARNGTGEVYLRDVSIEPV